MLSPQSFENFALQAWYNDYLSEMLIKKFNNDNFLNLMLIKV